MESILNLNRETHKVHHKKIIEHLDVISKWIQCVGGSNEDKALEFVEKYLHHLSDNTKKSMFEYIFDLTGTRLIDINKQNDLMLLINELCALKQQIKYL